MKTSTKVAFPFALSLALLGSAVFAQRAINMDPRTIDFESVLGFEVTSGDELPSHWSSRMLGADLSDAITLDHDIVHSGNSALKIARAEPVFGEGLRIMIPIDFTGTTVEVRGFLRTEDVQGFVLIGGREPVQGTQDWTEYRASMPLDPTAHTLDLNVGFSGEGTIWVDDLEVLVDGQPLQDLPRIDREPTDQEIAELIAQAESAAYQSITDNATIKTVYGANIKVLREGSNGWTCWAEALVTNTMCNEPEWDAWLMAAWNNDKSFEVERLSTAYMLNEGEGEVEPPHVMLLVPDSSMLNGLPAGRDEIWVMYPDTPYEHMMLNTGDPPRQPPRRFFGR